VTFISYLFGKKESQLFNQLPEDILIAKLEPWHHLQAYGVLFLTNTRQKRKREREASTLALLFLVSLEVRYPSIKEKKKMRRQALNSKTTGHLKN